MLSWMAFAKTMDERTGVSVPLLSEPLFQDRAMELAGRMARMSLPDLMEALVVNGKLAEQAFGRYRMILHGEAERIPALLAYTGMVFKRVDAVSFTGEDWLFAQEHLRIMSGLYGLLRPMDRISAYRMEGRIPLWGKESSVFAFWRPLLTPVFVREAERLGGVLLDLASEEMRLFLDWPQVEKRLRILRPEFYEMRNGKPRTVTVYAKMCRGEMLRFVIRNRIDDPESVLDFAWDGFRHFPYLDKPGTAVFVR